MNYKLDLDGIYSGIKETNELPVIKIIIVNNKKHKVSNDIYTTFEEAKKELIKELKRRKSDWDTAIFWAKKMTVEQTSK